MKKALVLLLALAMVLSLAACGSAPAATPAEEPAAAPTAAEGEVYTVGICQLVQHVALDAATQGFKDALTEALGDKRHNLWSRMRAGRHPDLRHDRQRLRFRRRGSHSCQRHARRCRPPSLQRTPSPFSAPRSPNTALRWISKTLTAPWAATSPVRSDLAPLDQQAAMILELFPDAEERSASCTAPPRPNSVYQADVVKAALEQVRRHRYRCTPLLTPTMSAAVTADRVRRVRRALHPDRQHRRVLRRGHQQRGRARRCADHRRRGRHLRRLRRRHAARSTTTSSA